MTEEHQLWGQLKRGERDAFDQIYRTYIDVLFKYGYKFTKDTKKIEHCIHDLFICIWKNREDLADATSIKRYLLTLFRTRIIKDLKKSQKTKLKNKEEMEIHFDLELSKEHAIVQEESIIENKALIDQAFKNLSHQEKEAVYLKYYNHMPTDKLCKIMNITYPSFRTVLSSAIQKMSGKILK